jgi:hypothetical protein
MLALVAWFLGARAFASDPDYQRYDLVREASELTLEASFHYWTQEIDAYNLHTLRFGASAEYVFKTNHSISLSLPYTLSVSDNPDVRQVLFYALGDISLGYEYLLQCNHLNIFAGPLVTIPLTESTEYALREGVLTSSGGRYQAGVRAALTGILDPIVWNVDLHYLIGLPKKERFYSSWQPGNIQVSAGFSHLINHQFGVALAVTERLTLPLRIEGHWDPRGMSVSTLGKGEFFILFEKDYVRLSVETNLYPLNRPWIIGLVYGHTVDLSKTPP